MNQDLAKYINKAIADGMSEAEIKNKLIDAGWQEKDINNAFSAHEKLDLNKTPVFKEKAKFNWLLFYLLYQIHQG